jgi:hypothetical protein
MRVFLMPEGIEIIISWICMIIIVVDIRYIVDYMRSSVWRCNTFRPFCEATSFHKEIY